MFGWKDSFAIGVPMIDTQHRQLFDIIEELHQAMKTGKAKAILGQTLEKLVQYTAKHFATEEAMLRRYGYVDPPGHKQIHDSFTAKIRNFQSDHAAGAVLINIELMNLLQDWLVDHIQGT